MLLDKSDRQGVMNYLQGFLKDCGWRADRGLAEFYCAHSGETIRWMEVRSKEAGFPPYSISKKMTTYDDSLDRKSVV